MNLFKWHYLFGFLMSLFIFSGVTVCCQTNTTEQLAIQYYQNKEFDKAVLLFEDLYGKTPNPFIYDYYFNCLLELKDYKKAEKFLLKQIKKQPANVSFLVDLGYVYLTEENQDAARKQFESAIKSLIADKDQVILLANAFLIRNQTNYALKTYEQGQKLLKNYYGFNLELAEIYFKKNDLQSGFNQYFDFIGNNPNELEQVESKFQDLLLNDADNTKNDLFKSSLLQRIKKDPDVKAYPVLLLWYFIQEKEFAAAITQAKAIDKRFNEDGARIISLARISASNNFYDEAIECYDYIITKKGEMSPYYEASLVEKLQTKYQKITSVANVNIIDIESLEKEYYSLLSGIEGSNYGMDLIKNLAHLQAFYLNKPQQAIELLQKALKYENVLADKIASCKIELGNIYLLTGNVWEASLLYSQVEKAFKNDVLGYEAKFKNALLYYYINEFKYSKAQLDVLKAATSKLIANDAIELSLLISDNMDADSSFTGLKIFARADLLLFQNKDDLALITIDSISMIGLTHPLFDDVLLKKAKIKIRQEKYAEADSLLEKLVAFYPDDILADKALYMLGQLNETKLNNKTRAMEFYQKLLTDYPGSIFAVDARKRFRNLRGDKIN
ncbi:MAG: tetratricopeptide repeat protein [Bacteroidota bacterium]